MANGFLSVAGPQPRDLSPLARSLAAVVAATFRSAMRLITPFFFAALVTTVSSFQAAEPIRYRLSFPEPQHRWMQVEASFAGHESGTLELRSEEHTSELQSLTD